MFRTLKNWKGGSMDLLELLEVVVMSLKATLWLGIYLERKVIDHAL